MAARSLNKVQLIGNLTRDPEMRYTPQGTAVTTFGLATNRSWKTDSGELREEADFHRIVAWNKLAELCSQLLTKGRKVYIEGRLQTRTFTGSDNAQHTVTEIVIGDMILLDSRRPEAVGTETASSPVAVPAGEPIPIPVAPAPRKTKKTKSTDEKEEKKPKEETGTEEVNVDDIPF